LWSPDAFSELEVYRDAFLAQVDIYTVRKRSKIVATNHVSWAQNYQIAYAFPSIHIRVKDSG